LSWEDFHRRWEDEEEEDDDDEDDRKSKVTFIDTLGWIE
jgi:hypothetical protein